MSENKDVENYRYLLKDLTHPAKPLIASLTFSLREHFAPQSVSQLAILVVSNLRESSFVIPALYLVDSVAKNLAGPWVQAMSDGGLAEAFVIAYRRCARPEEKKEMQRVFLTWSPALLPASMLQEINDALSSTSAAKKRLSIITTNTSAEKKPKVASPLLLNSAELSKLVLQIQPHKRLYSQPRQCANCGLRFPESEAGREAHRIHLDGHFRRKARLRQKTKRVLARDWFLSVQDWTASLFLPTAHTTEQEHSDKSAYFKSTSEKTENKSMLDEDDVSSLSVISAGDDPQNTLCAQCNEPMQAVWDDETEQWVFKAAKQNTQGRPCHASCL